MLGDDTQRHEVLFLVTGKGLGNKMNSILISENRTYNRRGYNQTLRHDILYKISNK